MADCVPCLISYYTVVITCYYYFVYTALKPIGNRSERNNQLRVILNIVFTAIRKFSDVFSFFFLFVILFFFFRFTDNGTQNRVADHVVGRGSSDRLGCFSTFRKYTINKKYHSISQHAPILMRVCVYKRRYIIACTECRLDAWKKKQIKNISMSKRTKREREKTKKKNVS